MGISPWKWVGGAAFGLGSALAGFYQWAKGPAYRPGAYQGRIHQIAGAGPVAERARADGARAPMADGDGVKRPLRVMSWNIAWGYGWGSEGSGARKSQSQIEANLKAMGEALRVSGADIVCLQEVDFAARRSFNVDQAQFLADLGGYAHMAKVVTWQANYVPFPGLNPREHWGKMVSGGAILSRYPLLSHRYHLFEKPKANAFYYNAFYPGRYIQGVRVDHPLGEIEVHNLHLEAFDRVNREAQAQVCADFIQSPTPHKIITGDFNTVPQGAQKRHGYDDEPETDHRDEMTLVRFGQLPDIFQVEDMGPQGFTFPSHRPNRRLDHLFAQGFQSKGIHVVQDAGEISDHLPIICDLMPA